jgi:hypothetical protein
VQEVVGGGGYSLQGKSQGRRCKCRGTKTTLSEILLYIQLKAQWAEMTFNYSFLFAKLV